MTQTVNDAQGAGPPAQASTLRSANQAGLSRFAIWPRRWLYVALGALGVSLARGWGLPWAQSAVLAGILIVLADQLLRWAVTRRLSAFDAELQALLQSGARDQLLARYGDQLFLRAFAPRHELCERLGMIHKQRGAHRAAADALREAVEEAPPKEAPGLAHKLADAYYAAGELLEAERYYRLSQDTKHANAGVRARIARLIIGRGGDRAEAARLLQEAVEAAKGQPGCGVFRCQLAELLAELGQRDEALWHLQIAEEELVGGSAEEQVRLADACAAVERAAG